MHTRPTRTHAAELREIESLWGAAEGTEAGDRLDVLVTLVAVYEARCWPIDPLDPVQAIGATMGMDGHTRVALAATAS